ncbi:MAG: hypothetical protein NTX03_10005 [Bacteroidetes bacterium]|nr:hypothetical protein [Bacteroidota bacterium]
MKKIICVCTILLAMGSTLPAKLSAQDYKINWCGKSGKISKATVDSLFKADCRKLSIENGGGMVVSRFRIIIVPKGGGRQMLGGTGNSDLIPDEFLSAFKNCKKDDMILFTDVMIKKGNGNKKINTNFNLIVE